MHGIGRLLIGQCRVAALAGHEIAVRTVVTVKHAIDGYHGPDGNFMPPKGGNPALTDEQATNAVHWLVDQVK